MPYIKIILVASIAFAAGISVELTHRAAYWLFSDLIYGATGIVAVISAIAIYELWLYGKYFSKNIILKAKFFHSIISSGTILLYFLIFRYIIFPEYKDTLIETLLAVILACIALSSISYYISVGRR